MTTPAYHWARLQDSSGPQVHEILQARESVFVVEQNCPYQDADDADALAWHMTGRVDGKLACYVRVVDPGIKYPEPSIGRVLTTPEFRARGLGAAMMREAIRQTNSLFPGQNIRIGAQAYLHDFYTALGFDQVSEEYFEDGIPHILMLWRYPADNK
ncbi:MAG: GNAT family N-acetyltransferase [Gammaproteobacteria bacterium]|nr:GNAT family N-acetyltransferase [Gammaproteobacteria bacterium]